MRIKRADWVKTKKDSGNMIGFVVRVARDGTWADVKWQSSTDKWSKRMQQSHLVVQHTLDLPCGATVTDSVRKQELEEEARRKPWHCGKCGKRMQFYDGLCWKCFGGDPGR